MTIRRWFGSLSLLAAAALLLPATADAQFQDRGVQITVWGGPYGSLGTLGNATRLGVPIAETSMDNGAGFGGSVEVPIPIERLALRADVSVVPSATMQTVTFFGCPMPASETTEPEHCRARSDGTLLTGTADLVFRTEQDFTRPHGIFIIGFGLKNYSFGDKITLLGLPGQSDQPTTTTECVPGDFVCETHRSFTGSTTDPTLHLGFGLSGNAGPVNLMGEVADYVSIFSHVPEEGQMQEEMVHDLFLKLSAGVRVF